MVDEVASNLERWRQRYYDSLAELEAKEQHWGAMESLLRRSISRLTLLADGVDAELDQQLERLRNSIREEQDIARIKRLVDAIFAASEHVQRTPMPVDEPRIADAMCRLVDQLPFPPGMARKVKAFRSQSDRAPDTTAVLSGFAALVREALTTAPLEPESPPSERHRGAMERRASTEPSAGAVGEVLLRFLNKLPVPPALEKTANGLKQRASNAADEKEFYALADELAALITEIERGSVGTSVTASLAPADVLIQLLDSLSLPAEMEGEVTELKERLDNELGEEGVTQALKAIASLVAEVRTRAQRERQDTENFLKQLSDRLQDLDQQLRGADSVRMESRESSRQLHVAIQEEFSGIETTVKGAADLDRLKLGVQERLDGIRAHMNGYRKAEEERNERAEAQIHALTARLHDLEGETERLRKNIQQARTKALHDPLTGMYNRVAFEERMAQEYARWQRYDSPLVLVLWDLDLFKQVNDTYGHKAGDKVLKTVARLFTSGMRATDFSARYGGEEFVSLLPEATLETARHVADKVREQISGCGFHHAGKAVPVTVSCGIAQFRDADTPDVVFDRADRALYRAKQLGRNRCCVEEV